MQKQGPCTVREVLDAPERQEQGGSRRAVTRTRKHIRRNPSPHYVEIGEEDPADIVDDEIGDCIVVIPHDL